MRIPFDELWKSVIDANMAEFLQLLFPQLYEQIDLSQGCVLLDQELAEIAPDSQSGRKMLDKLIRVELKAGGDQWILIHVEVQGYRDTEFSERMFRYFYRIYDKYHRRIVSAALFTDGNRNYRPDRWEYEYYGCGLNFWYNTLKIIDYSDETLEGMTNPFGLVLWAAKRALKSRKDRERLYRFKKELIGKTLHRGYERDRIRSLIRFIDGILYIPDVMKNKLLYEEIRSEEGEEPMTYLTSFDEIILQEKYEQGLKEGKLEGEIKGKLEGEIKGKLEGETKGKLEGEIKGKLEGARDVLISMMKARYGEIPSETMAKLKRIRQVEKIEALARQVLATDDIQQLKL